MIWTIGISCFLIVYIFSILLRLRRSKSFLWLYILVFFYLHFLLSNFFFEFSEKFIVSVFGGFLFCLLLFGIIYFNGWRNIFDFFANRFNSYSNVPFSLGNYGIMWIYFKKAEKSHIIITNKKGNANKNYLFFACLLIVIFSFKELIKRVLVLFILGCYYKYSIYIFLFFAGNYLLIIFLISLIAISKYNVLFIERYFGPYVFGWLGSYQYVFFGQTYLSVHKLKDN